MVLTTKEQHILNSIKVRSENDPNNPEFPPENPKFPATPTTKISVPGFSNVWFKDESKNPSGTHKDRLAWEIIVTYKDFLLAKKEGKIKGKLPQFSIISSGSAAFSIQKRLREYDLPALKVLVDNDLDDGVYKSLEKIGCELFRVDLSKQALSSEDILKLTNNQDGFDITSSEALDPTTRFYDWLSYEIINSSPDYCFIPFGTGNLYENILNINKKEVSTKYHDPRFKGKVTLLKNCNFMGATTNFRKTKAQKLYSPHLPFVHFSDQWIKIYRYAGFCGPKSDVYLIQEKYLDEAIILANELHLDAEPSALGGLALFLQMKKNIHKDKKILIVSTGNTKY